MGFSVTDMVLSMTSGQFSVYPSSINIRSHTQNA